MRATILLYCQYNGQGVYCGLSSASDVFLIFYYPTIPMLQCFFFYLHCLVTSLKYSVFWRVVNQISYTHIS